MQNDGKLLVHERFALRAAAQPDAIAVEHGSQQISFSELDARADALARRLRERGAARNSVVISHLERSIDLIVSLLATWKAGATYLPVDPGVPGQRLAAFLEETGCTVAVTRGAGRHGSDAQGHRAGAVFADRGVSVLDVTADAGPLEDASRRAREEEAATGTVETVGEAPTGAPAGASDGAYIIYTSGSTGAPKGVKVAHASLRYLCDEINTRYGIGPDDRVLQFADITFDTSLEQILVPLLHGATLVLPDRVWAPSELPDELIGRRVTVMDLTPSYWRAFLAGYTPRGDALPVRLTIVGGSAMNAEDCRTALRLMPESRLVNAYGLTETTITSCTMEITSQALPESGPAPVGTPLTHTAVHVFDDHLRPVPPGRHGEVYVAGRGVAEGYLGASADQARFLPDPYGEHTGARMYRTGDRGGWTHDGNLEIVGRVDRQLKVRGFRVEPAEIEAALSGHEGVVDVAVTAYDQGGEPAIAAYYTAVPAAHAARATERDAARVTERDAARVTEAEPSDLRAFLAGRLPRHMVPSAFVRLTAMPLMANGKVDLASLPAPEHTGERAGDQAATPAAGAQEEAGGLIERVVAGLWCQVLGREDIEPHDNFFALGGNSITAAELLAKVRASLGILITQVRPLIRLLLLEDATLRSFAKAVESARSGALFSDDAKRVDFVAETELNVPLAHVPEGRTLARDPADPAHVVLTGATGFLGVYLLRELLTTTEATVHCLVRADGATHGMERLQANARHYLRDDLEEYREAGRIRALPGDLAEPLLGLSEEHFDALAHLVDVIHHPGGLVNFIYPYAHMRPANVEGTREIIRLAGRYRNAPVHYISTMAVVSGFGTAGVRHVTEETPAAHADHLSVGYVESKWVAEGLLHNAAEAGLPVAVHRAADISGDRASGAWNTATEMCAMKRFMVDTGTSPRAELPLDYTPVDCFAAAVVHIASQGVPSGEVYHLTNPAKVNVSVLAERLRAHGHTIREVPWDQWLDHLVEFAVEKPDHPMTPFAPLFIDRCATGTMSVAEMYLETTFPTFSRDNVEAALRGSGIDIPPVDAEMLDRYIRYLTAIDFL